jgi:hypothetical protein
MNIALTLAWWHLPLAITVLVFVLWLRAAYVDFRDGGMFSGIGALFYAVPTLLVIAISWAVGGILK